MDAHLCGALVPGVPLLFKALRKKDYSEAPQTLGEHLKKWRRELGLFQREAAARMGIATETYINWEKGKTEPVAAQFRPGRDLPGPRPYAKPQTPAERLKAKRRALGVTFSQVARHLGWDTGTLTRYLNGTWWMPPNRATALEAFLAAEAADLAPIHQLPRQR